MRVTESFAGRLHFCKLIEHARDPESPDADELRLNARDLEPADEAKRYLLERMANGYRRLVFWRGEFWLWKGGCWRMQQAVDLKADVVNYLNPRYSRLAVPHTNNVLMQLQAQSHLMPWIDQPAWLGDRAPEWDPRDVLPMKNALVYLPSFLEQKSDYSTPPTPRFFSPTVLSYDWDPNPPRPAAWLGFLASIFENDDEALSTLQEWAGYLLTGDTSQQKMLALFGPKRAGKGTICRVLQALLGEQNCCGPTLTSLGTQFGLSPLIGKSLGVISDARLRRGAESAIIIERMLSITGEDTMTIDRKFREPFTGKLPTRLMLASNELPRFSDASGAIASRLIILRLTKSFYGREDAGLNQRLRQELPGILHWAIEGWRRLRNRGYVVQPASGSDLVDHLNELSSPIGAFIADRCDLGQAYRVYTAELYQAWRAWANAKGMSKDIGTEGEFGKDLRAAAAEIDRRRIRNMGNVEYFYLGIRLKVTI